jgi:hypothetical protein
VLRRVLPTVAVVLALGLVTGCADDVSPAARFGDETITHDELMAQVEAWASAPALVEAVGSADPRGDGGSGYNTQFVDAVLTNELRFRVHEVEFERLRLELTPEEIEGVRGQLLAGGALADVDDALLDQLAEAFARGFRVEQELAEGYEAWAADAFDDIEVSSRYGAWDPAAQAVLPPEGPRPAPGDATFEL